MNNLLENSELKVALVDNMNNNFFSISRYLRHEGIDAHLFLMPGMRRHFEPENDTFEDVTGYDWIHTYPVKVTTTGRVFGLYSKKLKNTFERYDLVICCGSAIGDLHKANIQLDIIFPYGSDLYSLPFREQTNTKGKIRKYLNDKLSEYQKDAFQDARAVCINAGFGLYKDPLVKMNINWINETVPILYNLEHVNIDLSEQIDSHIIDKLNNSEFVVFNHARQSWSTNSNNLQDFDENLGLKRNDKVIDAFAQFVRITKIHHPILVLFEYGTDIDDSKNLIEQLNISSNVIWLPKSPRKIILKLLQKYATFGTDQFRENISGGLSGVTFEVLASGVSLITHHSNPQQWYIDSPIVEALTINDILNTFVDYEKNHNKHLQNGQLSKQWFDEYLGLGLAKRYVKLIKLLVSNKKLCQNDQIVRDVFSGMFNS